MLARAFAAEVPAAWVTGDEVYGNDGALRRWLEGEQRPYVLAVARSHPVWHDGVQVRVEALVAADAGGRLAADRCRGGQQGTAASMTGPVPGCRTGREDGLGAVAAASVARSATPEELAFYRAFGREETHGRRAGAGGGDALDDRGRVPARQGGGAGSVRGAALGGVVSAHHAVPAGPCLPRGDAGGSADRRKRGDAGGLIPLTAPEVRRLLAVLLPAPASSAQHRLHWSRWRRQRQAEARRSHYKRRLSRSFTNVPL